MGHMLPLGSEVKPVKSFSFTIQIASEATLMLVLLRNVLNYTDSLFSFFCLFSSPRDTPVRTVPLLGRISADARLVIFFSLHQVTAGLISFLHVMTCHPCLYKNDFNVPLSFLSFLCPAR